MCRQSIFRSGRVLHYSKREKETLYMNDNEKQLLVLVTGEIESFLRTSDGGGVGVGLLIYLVTVVLREHGIREIKSLKYLVDC